MEEYHAHDESTITTTNDHNDQYDDIDENKLLHIPTVILPIRPLVFVTKLISLQAEIVSNCIVSLASPFLSLASLLYNSFFGRPRDDPIHDKVDLDAYDYHHIHERIIDDDDDDEPRGGSGGGGFLLGKRILTGLLAAAYVCAVLVGLLMVAAVLGVGVVRQWVEKPLYVRESLQFDYSEAHPTAVYSFANKAAEEGGGGGGPLPVGHTLYVSLVLLMPESDYNREVGIFQLTAELISTRGELMRKSSHPCMLRFRSWPIRVVRTFMMGVPLLLGITTETQSITFPAILKHKEAVYPRTQAVRITLIPRAGTLELPQFYDADIVVESRLPWMKGLVYRWKWTFYVWTSMHMFTLLVMMAVLFLRPLLFPVLVMKSQQETVAVESVVSREPLSTDVATKGTDEREVSEALRRWQRSRNKRKAALLRGAVVEPEPEPMGTSASSITVTREQTTGGSFEEGIGDSESVVS